MGFVKDFNYDYLACVEVQERNKWAWRNEVLAFNVVRETRIVHKELQTFTMIKNLTN